MCIYSQIINHDIFIIKNSTYKEGEVRTLDLFKEVDACSIIIGKQIWCIFSPNWILKIKYFFLNYEKNIIIIIIIIAYLGNGSELMVTCMGSLVLLF